MLSVPAGIPLPKEGVTLHRNGSINQKKDSLRPVSQSDLQRCKEESFWLYKILAVEIYFDPSLSIF